MMLIDWPDSSKINVLQRSRTQNVDWYHLTHVHITVAHFFSNIILITQCFYHNLCHSSSDNFFCLLNKESDTKKTLILIYWSDGMDAIWDNCVILMLKIYFFMTSSFHADSLLAWEGKRKLKKVDDLELRCW